MNPVLERLGEPPALSKFRGLNRFMQISAAGLAGESDFSDEEIRGLLRALLPEAALAIKQLATFDQVSDANERAESTLRQHAAAALGEIGRTIKIAHETAVNAAPHELMPDDWCEKQLASLAELLQRVSIAITELHQSMLPIHPPAQGGACILPAQSEPQAQARGSASVSRESGGQPAATGSPPAGRVNADGIPF